MTKKMKKATVWDLWVLYCSLDQNRVMIKNKITQDLGLNMDNLPKDIKDNIEISYKGEFGGDGKWAYYDHTQKFELEIRTDYKYLDKYFCLPKMSEIQKLWNKVKYKMEFKTWYHEPFGGEECSAYLLIKIEITIDDKLFWKYIQNDIKEWAKEAQKQKFANELELIDSDIEEESEKENDDYDD